MKSTIDRIAYYTKKASQYGEKHHSLKRNPYRWNRLMNYKKTMHEQIEKERLQ